MEIFFHHSYNLDVLNLMNLTIDEHLRSRYPQEYLEFSQALSQESRSALQEIAQALGNPSISPLVAFVISVLPQFEKTALQDLLLDEEAFLAAIETHEPRLMTQKELLLLLFKMLAPVVQEIEMLGFREYWVSEFLPELDERIDQMETSLARSGFEQQVTTLLKADYLPEEIHVYFCALNGGNGIRLTRQSTMVDVSFSDLHVINFILSDLLKKAISKQALQTVNKLLSTDAFILIGFDKSKPVVQINDIQAFLKDNLSEALRVFLIYRAGFITDLSEIIQSFIKAGYVFSIILLDFLLKDEQSRKPINEILDRWMSQAAQLPLRAAYDEALQNFEKSGR